MDHQGAEAAQWMLCQLAGDPAQFTASGFSAMFQQAMRERYGHGDEMSYLEIPF